MNQHITVKILYLLEGAVQDIHEAALRWSVARSLLYGWSLLRQIWRCWRHLINLALQTTNFRQHRNK